MNTVKPEGRPLRSIDLDNGLTIQFYNQSKRVAGNRWQVKLLVIVPVSVELDHFQELADPESAHAELTAAFGRVIVFSLEKVRNFLEEEDVDPTLEQMSQEFLQLNLGYLSSDKFSQRFVVKEYLQWKEKEDYRRKHSEAIRRAE